MIAPRCTPLAGTPDPLAAPTLTEAFRVRVAATPDAVAYLVREGASDRWTAWSWAKTAATVGRWQAALAGEGLAPGARVAVQLPNGIEWVLFDRAALALGLVTVPLYAHDRPENVAWVLDHAEVSLLLTASADDWRRVREVGGRLPGLRRVVVCSGEDAGEPRLHCLTRWLDAAPASAATPPNVDADTLATIAYTSGTSGRPKGVMLSHRNLVWNVRACLRRFAVTSEDRLLSFLPLSHMLERTVGYYLATVAGATIGFNHDVTRLAEDLTALRPTLLVTVPRIFERVSRHIDDALERGPGMRRWLFDAAVVSGWARHEYDRGAIGWSPRLLLQPLLDRIVAAPVRARLGGRLRFAVCGGAPLDPRLARRFGALGIPIVQGYGLTEASPVVAANPVEDNVLECIGPPLPGVEVRFDARGELLTRSPSVMRGYWRDDDATVAAIDADGWLRTGDLACLDTAGRLRITGRAKEIIVLSNGEKVPPGDVEQALTGDRLIEQVLLIGEGRPFLAALIVPEPARFAAFASSMGLDPARPGIEHEARLHELLIERVDALLAIFPGYARVRRIGLVREPWTTANGLLTPTLKLRRTAIQAHYHDLIESLYAGH